MSYYQIIQIVAGALIIFYTYIFIKHYIKADKKARKNILIVYGILAVVSIIVMVFGLQLRHLIFPFIEDRQTLNGEVITPTELPLENQEHIKDTFEIK